MNQQLAVWTLVLVHAYHSSRQSIFLDAILCAYREQWEPLNKAFYKKNGLVHELVDGKYNINFSLSGFDRDPVTSLIIEAKKVRDVAAEEAEHLFNNSAKNYNRYSRSLLSEQDFRVRLDGMNIAHD